MTFTYDKSYIDEKLEEIKKEGYSYKQITTEQLLQCLLDWMKDIEHSDYDEIIQDVNDNTIYAALPYLANGYKYDENDPLNRIILLDTDNEGDGNPLGYLFVLKDIQNKTYSLFECSGTYSSWDSSNWEDIKPVNLEVVEVYQSQTL